MKILKYFIICLLFPVLLSAQNQTGSVIFLHPDGASLSHWSAMRTFYFGPDAICGWDKIPNIGLYREHCQDNLSPESTSGATMHSYGVKVKKSSYGMNGTDTISSLSGKKMSIMHEALAKGIKTGLINSGSIIEPGTGAFVTKVGSRKNYEEITKQIMESGVDVILSGGEEWFLPKGVKGRHTSGKREDGLDLISYAKQKGYYVVYNRDELMTLPITTEKLLGIFSEGHTFNDKTEEELKEKNLPLYKEGAPTLLEMTKAAVKILSKDNKQYFLVVEEEGSDNFSNANNSQGTLLSLKRADDVIEFILELISNNPELMLITASDSNAGGLTLMGIPEEEIVPDSVLPERMTNGSPIDGRDGTGSLPFNSAPDKEGKSFPFVISWSSYYDVSGGVVCKAAGFNAELINGVVDNTDIYRFMYCTLFNKLLDKK
jgi:alkaline phosphatase